MSRAIVVVPCFNEANRLDARRFQEFAAASQSIRFLFVNDGSTDGTLGVLERLHAVLPDRCQYLHLSRNSGKAEAVRRGVLTALREQPQYVGFWDADLATPLEEIPRFCRVLDETPNVEVVIGTRLNLLGHKIQRRRLRHWLGRLFANVAGIVLGAGIYDTQCGAKLFRASETCAALFDEPFLARWIFDVELFARLIAGRGQLGGTYLEQIIYEYPLESWQEVAGSRLKTADFVKSFTELVRIYWTYLGPGLMSPAVAVRMNSAGHPVPTSISPLDRRGTTVETKRSGNRRAA
jgi:dolichyl-phosphate beta-glucosyltransferase